MWCISSVIFKGKAHAPRRWKSGSRALKEISQHQKTGSLLIRKAPFARLVKKILMNGHPAGDQFHWQRAAIECLQEAVEAYIVRYLSDANLCTLHAKRVMLTQIRILRGDT